MPVLLLVIGCGFGFIGGSPIARYFFGASIIFSLIIATVGGFIMHRRAPRFSEAYVTWGAFVTVHMTTFMATSGALLWIAFELGKVASRVG